MKLLSGGYSIRNFAAADGTIDVWPWDSNVTAFMQERLESGKPGDVLFDLLGKIMRAPESVVENFVASEVTSVLLFSRALTNDQCVEYDGVCVNPRCKAVKRERLKVPDQLERIGEKAADYTGSDFVTLKRSKDRIEVRQLLVRDERSLAAAKLAEGVTKAAARVMLAIASINGTQADNADEMATYYAALDPQDVQQLSDFISLNEPKLGATVEHQCDSCGSPFSKELSLDSSFFRPKS